MPGDSSQPEDDNDRSDAGNTAPNGSNKRKRGAGPSSRGVANLTPEQLERKRANDREAQRAIRERTKQQIERLNQRIQELESSQPYQELQAVIAQKEAVQAENDEIKRQLASFISTFQRMINVPASKGLENLAAAAERSAPTYNSSAQPQIRPQPELHAASTGQPDHESPHGAPSIGSPISQTSTSRPFQFGQVQPPQSHRPWISTSSPTYERPQHARNTHSELHYSPGDERLGVDYLVDNHHFGKAINGASNRVEIEPAGQHNALPKLVAATCPLDAILLDAVAERQRAIKAGMSKAKAVGPPYPNFNALLDPHTGYASHPISKLFTDILRTFPDLATLPEQVAVIHVMFLVMRWKIDPSKENYERLPEWVRPVPSQLFTPHPCWNDYLPWPILRDKIVQSQPQPHFDGFFIPYTTTLSLNWPYSPSDVLIATPPPPQSVQSPASNSSQGIPDEPIWRMNPVFEEHLKDLRNWSLGPLFRDTFPNWVDAVRIES